MGATADKVKGTTNEAIGKAKQGVGEAGGSDNKPGRDYVGGRAAATSPFSHRIRIDDVGRRTGGIGGDLVENIRELDFVFLARDVAEVRRANHVAHVEQR